MYIIFIFFNVLYICIQYVNHQYKTIYILLLSFYVSSDYYKTIHSSSNTLWYIWLYISDLSKHISQHFVVHVVISVCPFTLYRGFFTPKIVGTFYMQGYKVKEKNSNCTPLYPQFQNSVGTLLHVHSLGDHCRIKFWRVPTEKSWLVHSLWLFFW